MDSSPKTLGSLITQYLGIKPTWGSLRAHTAHSCVELRSPEVRTRQRVKLMSVCLKLRVDCRLPQVDEIMR
jgi:hypothetical protein